jgi:hypothetical protein
MDAQGLWLVTARAPGADKKTVATYLDLSAPGTYTINLQSLFDPSSVEGPGYLAGDFPGGITSRLDSPVSATVKVLHRLSDGQIVKVAETVSAPDGTWSVQNLDITKQFDVICSLAGFNDLIWAGVTPTPYPYAVVLDDQLSLAADGLSLEGSVTISGGTGPFTLNVTGNPPPGITFNLVGEEVVATGSCAVPGDYTWTVSVTDSASYTASVVVTIEGFVDEFWDDVIASLPFLSTDSATFTNYAGTAWVPGVAGQASIVADSEGSDGFLLSLLGTNANSNVQPSGGTIPYKTFAQSFTVEFTIKAATKSDAWLFSIGGTAVTWSSGDAALDLLVVTLGGALQVQARNNTSSPQVIAVPGAFDTSTARRLAVSFDQPTNTLRCYVDRALVGAIVLTNPLTASSSRSVRIGGAAGASNATYVATAKYDDYRHTLGVARMTGADYPGSDAPFYHP